MAKTKYLRCDVCGKRIQCELHRKWARCQRCRAVANQREVEVWGKVVRACMPTRNCLHCGKPFKAHSKKTQHCSVKCGRAKYRSGKYANSTERETIKGQRRRARIKSVYVEDVVPSVVFERDNWTCQICKQPVDRTLHGWNRMAASLDHIIPLSQGGLHSYSNVQLAHKSCNCSKGARWAGQLTLI